MSRLNLFQANSLEQDHNDVIIKKIIDGVRYGLNDYLNYINQSIKVVQETGSIRIPLKKVVEKITTGDAEKIQVVKYYIVTDKLSDKNIERIESELFEKEINSVYLEKPTGKYAKDKEYEIIIEDRNGEEGYLVFDMEDEIKYIYLKANDYQLRKQKDAVFTLMNRPLQEHMPLQKLFDMPEKAQYFFKNNYERLNNKLRWEILTKPEEFDGTGEQRDFVEKALKTKDFALLEGPPGSGKTTAIIELIIQLIKQGKRVLLVSATHVAVDNVFHRILTTYKNQCEGLVVPIRISNSQGSIRKESVIPYRLQNFIKNTKQEIRNNIVNNLDTQSKKMLYESLKNANDFDDVILKSANLVGGTMIGILQHPDIKKGGIQEMFDVMIVDESSKVTFLDFIVPALYAKKWILVGDVNQLSPYTEDDFINENIDKIIKEPKIKEKLVHAFELKKKLISDNKWDKNSIKIIFSNTLSANDFKNDYNVYEIKNNFNPGIENILKLNGADIVICTPTGKNKKTIADYVFVKSMIFEDEINEIAFTNRQKAFHKVNSRNKKIDNYTYEFVKDRQQKWNEMVASRLSQKYQYRFEPGLYQQIKDELELLVPEEYSQEIEKIRRIALPSILELLQIGVGEKWRTTKDGETTYREEKLIYSGFRELRDVARLKFQSLSYQHRMNDEIADIPRIYFYKGKNLKTANTVDKRQNILEAYKPNEKDVIWVSNKDKTFRKKIKGKQRNINPKEVADIRSELKNFLEFAENNPMNDETGKNINYEMAILTFYREQERELRKMLREVTGQKNNNKFFHKNNVDIILCTVDKFQGDEADIVLLSFTKFTKKAFYNSPNRLNVALTRARYKLVLFGNQTWLAQNAQLEALKKLAQEKENRLTY